MTGESCNGFGRVAVLMGGASSEREVSLSSGRAVHAALQRAGVDALAIDWDGETSPVGLLEGFDRVFLILHGGAGENGTVQACLDQAGIAYTGSGMLGSAVGMDKLLCKRLWAGMRLPVAAYRVVSNVADDRRLIDALGLPMVIKPAAGGSSLGITLVREETQIVRACELAAREPGEVLAEEYIAGREFTVAIVADEVMPVVEIVPDGGFYDYHAKYVSDATRYICPPGLPDADLREMQDLALAAFVAVGCRGWGRVDLLRAHDGRLAIIEVNTAPGMTSHSLVPKAAAVAGVAFDELCCRILATASRDGAS